MGDRGRERERVEGCYEKGWTREELRETEWKDRMGKEKKGSGEDWMRTWGIG